jgi:hypothetical protein
LRKGKEKFVVNYARENAACERRLEITHCICLRLVPGCYASRVLKLSSEHLGARRRFIAGV